MSRFGNLEPKDKKSAFLELMTQPMGDARHKAISTIMRHRNISFEAAMKLQAMKIIGVTEDELNALERPKFPTQSSLGRQR